MYKACSFSLGGRTSFSSSPPSLSTTSTPVQTIMIQRFQAFKALYLRFWGFFLNSCKITRLACVYSPQLCYWACDQGGGGHGHGWSHICLLWDPMWCLGILCVLYCPGRVNDHLPHTLPLCFLRTVPRETGFLVQTNEVGFLGSGVWESPRFCDEKCQSSLARTQKRTPRQTLRFSLLWLMEGKHDNSIYHNCEEVQALKPTLKLSVFLVPNAKRTFVSHRTGLHTRTPQPRQPNNIYKTQCAFRKEGG